MYDLNTDISESEDVAAKHPERLANMKAFAKASHEPVQIGKYLDPKRTRHERDRQAKWGKAKPQLRAKRPRK